jgi:enolase
MPTVSRLSALEILDSRGRPTLRASCELSNGVIARASIPSGMSVGASEALELRDGDPTRFRGLGCLRAVRNVSEELNQRLAGRTFLRQRDLDEELIAIDGSAEKSRLGANALLSVSLAFARAHALALGEPLYRHFARMVPQELRSLPRPMINLFSGGKHAGGQIEIQDVLFIPLRATTIAQCLAVAFQIYQAAVEHVSRKYGMRALVADEGGLAPAFPSTEAMLVDALEAIDAAGLTAGADVALCLDLAATHFFRDGRYHMAGKVLTSAEMIAAISAWLEPFHIVSVEDGLAEDDWLAWPSLRQQVQGRALVVGDDLLTTHPTRIERAVQSGAADGLLLKVNQIGTVTEALDAMLAARAAGWTIVASARSGETEDDWLADLSVGWATESIKIGSITRSERLAKYNRLLEIEAEQPLAVAEWRRRR